MAHDATLHVKIDRATNEQLARLAASAQDQQGATRARRHPDVLSGDGERSADPAVAPLYRIRNPRHRDY